MTDMMAVCPVHGPFPFRSIGGGDNVTVTMVGSLTNCRECGRHSPIQDGVYTFVGNVVKAFRAVTKEDIEAFRDIAQAEKDGTLSFAEARERAAKINSSFADLLGWANGNAALLANLIAIITLFVALYTLYDSDQTATQAHSDAQRQTQAIQIETQVQQKIYESLQLQTKLAPHQDKPPPPVEPRNRKERRAAQRGRHPKG